MGPEPWGASRSMGGAYHGCPRSFSSSHQGPQQHGAIASKGLMDRPCCCAASRTARGGDGFSEGAGAANLALPSGSREDSRRKGETGMADRFRLIHFKSGDSERTSQHSTHDGHPSQEDRRKEKSLRLDRQPETFSFQTTLGQLKADLRHGDPEVRVLALRYLEQLDASTALPFLQEALSDQDVTVRTQAVRSLSRFRSSEATPLLRKGLRDANPAVRVGALRGLFLSGERLDQHLLLQLLSDESSWVRRKLATLLGWYRVEGALPVLTQLAKDPEAKVRKAALVSLLSLYPDEGKDWLFQAYRDEDQEIRLWARKALEKWITRTRARSF